MNTSSHAASPTCPSWCTRPEGHEWHDVNFPGQEWRVHEAALSSHFVGEALEDKDGVREYGIRVIKHLPDELDFTIARNLLIELARAVIWLDERNDSEASR